MHIPSRFNGLRQIGGKPLKRLKALAGRITPG